MVPFLGHPGSWSTEKFDFCQTRIYVQRERAQKEHRKEVDCVLRGICKETSSARPRGQKIRACTWQKGCNGESKWHWFSWKSLGSWGVTGCCENPLAAAASRGWKPGSLKESKTIRGQNQNVQQMPLALLAGYARSGFNSSELPRALPGLLLCLGCTLPWA